MPINHTEIIAEIQNHIRKIGGEFADWCVGTAKDPRSPFFESHRVAERSDGLIYREAFTASGAQAARDYLVNECGLRLDLEDAPEPGRIVFAFRKPAAHAEPVEAPTSAARAESPPANHLPFPKRAA